MMERFSGTLFNEKMIEDFVRNALSKIKDGMMFRVKK
jgi:hypothetical protein